MRPAKTQISLPRRLVRVFADRMCLVQPPGYPKRDEREPLPYLVDVQADLSLCWSHRSYCWFCRALANILKEDWIDLVICVVLFSRRFRKGTTFVTYHMLYCTPSPSEKGSTLGSKLFPFIVDPFSEGDKIIMTELPPLKMYSFPLRAVVHHDASHMKTWPSMCENVSYGTCAQRRLIRDFCPSVEAFDS